MSVNATGFALSINIRGITIAPICSSWKKGFFLVSLYDGEKVPLRTDEVLALFESNNITFKVWSETVNLLFGDGIPEDVQAPFRELIIAAQYPPVKAGALQQKKRRKKST